MNCFQKLLSSWWRTTWNRCYTASFMLWIAFKNYYLRDEGQQFKLFSYISSGCELLSKIIIFVMKDNSFLKGYAKGNVVNCFQKLLSSWWRTTASPKGTKLTTLWIAFKNYYLRDEGQHSIIASSRLACCELLSKIIIFVMKDNFYFV